MQLSYTSKIIVSLIFPWIPLSQTSDISLLLEAGQIGLTADTLGFKHSNYTAGTGLWCLFINVLYMIPLGIYLEQVVPKDFGTSKPWNFLCAKKYQIDKAVLMKDA